LDSRELHFYTVWRNKELIFFIYYLGIQKIEGIASYKEVCCTTTKDAVGKNHTHCLAVLTKSGNAVEMSPQQADVIIQKTIKEGKLSLLEFLWPLVEKTLHEDSKSNYFFRFSLFRCFFLFVFFPFSFPFQKKKMYLKWNAIEI
jgi:hypothetical protein